jgi:sodium/hydrogen antiporter
MYGFSGYHIILAVIGAAIVLAHWLPRWVSGREPAASALLIGFGYIGFGFVPGMSAALSPIASPKPWEVVSELCVIMGLFGVGIRIDRLRAMTAWKPTIRLLLIAMPLSILATTGAAWGFAGMTLAGALLLASVLAPTDPVLAGDVQVGPPLEGGEHPVRFTLTTEAGLNDGLAFPFVYLALALAAAGIADGALIAEWLWRDVGYRIIVGGASGVAVGWLLGKILFDWPGNNALAKTESALTAFAGVLIVYGVTELIEGYGFIAAFVAGLTMRRAEAKHEFHIKLHDFARSIEHVLTSILLVGLGAVIPVLLPELTLTGTAIGLLLILVVRPVTAWLATAGAITRRRERAVVAFYGVRGIGSIYYLGYAASHMALVDEAALWAIVAFTIVASTVIHGLTAGFAIERATGEAPPGTEPG